MASFVSRAAPGDTVWLYKMENGKRSRFRDARWGDFLDVRGQDGRWSKLKWGRDELWIETRHITDRRPLEVIFLDVGQGDGCIVVSPEFGPNERILVVDAGVSDNMYRFIKWRFGKLKKRFPFHAAVITHPDADHYYGFQPLFNDPKVEFERVYHNGLLERTGTDTFGPTSEGLLTSLGLTQTEVLAIYGNSAVRGKKRYPKLLHTALTSGRVGNVEALNTSVSHIPGFAPGDRDFNIEVLGPVLQKTSAGVPGLRWFGDSIGSTSRNEGKTKNGHSVLLRLTMNNFRLLLGGDLNKPAEDFLLRQHSGIAPTQPLADAIAIARPKLGSDVVKCCHHGSSDVTDEFLETVNPFAFIVSSGDNESHAHPRPDLLGRLGKHGRGDAPHIFCTEILRSSPENLAKEMDQLQKLESIIESPATGTVALEEAKAARKALQKRISHRTVGVYGAITLRTDGHHLQMSFQLESKRKGQRWQVSDFAWDASDAEWHQASGSGH